MWRIFELYVGPNGLSCGICGEDIPGDGRVAAVDLGPETRFPDLKNGGEISQRSILKVACSKCVANGKVPDEYTSQVVMREHACTTKDGTILYSRKANAAEDSRSVRGVQQEVENL